MRHPDRIEVLRDTPRGSFEHVLFDFDGTISLLREGWQQVMAPMMIETICGGATPDPRVESAVLEHIAESTGLQTILQMERLAEMVREHATVPDDEVLDARRYKAVFNERLMARVNERIAKLQSGEGRAEDFLLAGARAFLDSIAAHSPNMVVFSGTDRDDVRNEAALLGVAPYFTDIHGALGSIKEYSKEKVLKELMATHGLHGKDILIVGDGPVEMRIARDHGCFAVGVASDETQGRGWDPTKKRRLAEAGATILVPDFRGADDLISYLFSG